MPVQAKVAAIAEEGRRSIAGTQRDSLSRMAALKTAADGGRHLVELEALRKQSGAEGTHPQPVAPQHQAPKQAPTTGLAAPAVRGHLSPARPSVAPKRAEVLPFLAPACMRCRNLV